MAEVPIDDLPRHLRRAAIVERVVGRAASDAETEGLSAQEAAQHVEDARAAVVALIQEADQARSALDTAAVAVAEAKIRLLLPPEA